MKKTLVFTLAGLLASQSFMLAQQFPSLSPQRVEVERPTHRGFWWKLSAFCTAAAFAADTHSSWGRMEMNPLLRSSNGQFGLQGMSVKALIAGGAIGAQYALLRKHPKAEKYGIVTNFILAGFVGTAAVSNYAKAAQERREAAIR